MSVNEKNPWIDLASQRLGGKVLWANDDFFAPKDNLLKPSAPIFIDGKYTARGKWMDGWESRRRRTPGCDWCIVRLGLPGIVHRVIVDTSFFKGNFPERCSLDACAIDGMPSAAHERRLWRVENDKNDKKNENAAIGWTPLLPESPLQGDFQNHFEISTTPRRVTHLRFKIFPDGGVARLRILGEVVPDPLAAMAAGKNCNLAALALGARPIQSSDEFFGEPVNLLMPDRARNMSDGWETRRRRGPGHDWVILQLGVPGIIERIVLDTAHFKGNFPDSCSLDAARDSARANAAELPSADWQEVLPQTKLKANAVHTFAKELRNIGAVTHVRLNIYPDGGVSRLKIFGKPESVDALQEFNARSANDAKKALLDCCGARDWAKKMAAARPFATAEDAIATSLKIFGSLGEKAWLEAFRHHPPIGGRKAAKQQSSRAKSWSATEQSGVADASAEQEEQLQNANAAYAERFGYIFIICASGKTTGEMLHAVQQRLNNDPQDELKIAAAEQQKITTLRLQRLLLG